MQNHSPPPVRSERKIPILILSFPVTEKIRTLVFYKFDTSAMRLVRVLHS